MSKALYSMNSIFYSSVFLVAFAIRVMDNAAMATMCSADMEMDMTMAIVVKMFDRSDLAIGISVPTE